MTMKKWILDFLHRGLVACGFGPIVLAVIFLILHRYAGVETVTVDQLCRGIFSLSSLAFLVGGMNVVYQIERLPLMAAILIHGTVLYCGYLVTYLMNDWLQGGREPILIFSLIFVLGYIAIWSAIYFVTRKKTDELNERIEENRRNV